MGGQEGSRGYLYQGIATVLEALTENNWDKIFIEFPTTNDKVDIALSKDDKVITAIQVKSTENTFAPASVKQWLKDIYNDYKADSYELVLIGQCTADTLHFINAIPKYYKRDTIKLDKTATRVLSDFDTSILDSSSVKIRSLPYDLNSLHSILVTSLLKYLSQDNVVLSYVKIDLLAKALISEQLLHSTDGSYTDRSSFESSLKSRIHSIADTFRPHRIPVCIKSFTRDANHPDAVMEKTLDLCPVFDGRKIKPGLTWPENVMGPLIAFLTTATNQTERFKLYLETHTSIAFAAGRLFDSKSGVDIVPVQKTRTNGSELWELSGNTHDNFSDWTVQIEQINDDISNTVLILNITRDIRSDVEHYIVDSGLRVGRLITCSLPNDGGTNWAIRDGDHAAFLANRIYTVLACRTIPERRGYLHIFSAAPNGFMFYLGTVSRGFGKVILYEYDFEQADTCTYSPSVIFDSLGG